MDNKTKIDRLHDSMPKPFDTRNNSNWKALIASLGQADQDTADLIEEIRKQFFVTTASRPYLDKLGGNNNVARPKAIGMDDVTFRQYIPIVAYKPKQVKLIIDQLLNIFFFEESTTAFVSSSNPPYYLQDNWELEYTVDGINEERILFLSDGFVDISAATIEEVVSAINRQAKFSYAVKINDSITKTSFIRLFTKTIGAKGSIEMVGGRAMATLQFDGLILTAGNGTNTQWTVTKVGDTVTFTYSAGDSPGISYLKAGDIIIIDLPGNIGSFTINTVDLAGLSVTFTNVLATPGFFTQTNANQVKFLTPQKAVVYINERRAVTWEVRPGQIIVETPTSPPVVRRSLKGSAHVNGIFSIMQNRDSDTSLTVADASQFPTSGKFILDELHEIQTKIVTISENITVANRTVSRLTGEPQKYTYAGITGNTLTGISPILPKVASANEYNILNLSRDSNNIATCVTSVANIFKVGEYAIIRNSVPAVDINPAINLDVPLNGTWLITNIVNSSTFQFQSLGDQGQSSGGFTRVERTELANDGSKVILIPSQIDTGIFGPYVWDTNAAFVLASLTGKNATQIDAGKILRTIDLQSGNTIPNQEGFLIFDFGTEQQEGPVRMLFKSNSNSVSIDPAYVFKNTHSIGGSVTLIRNKGPHIMSIDGSEYAPYITDTSVGRKVLEDLILSVKSVGIFVEFLVRFPHQFYATLDSYGSGKDPG